MRSARTRMRSAAMSMSSSRSRSVSPGDRFHVPRKKAVRRSEMKNRNAQKAAKGFLVAATVWSLCDFGAAFAQVGMGAVTPPLGMTSPLGIGAAAPVGVTGVPLGATELATPGVSPMSSGSSASSAMTMTTPSACSSTVGAMQTTATATGNSPSGVPGSLPGESSATGAISGTSAPTPLFDGIGIAGTASGTCATATTPSSSPTTSASSPTIGSRSTVGRVGIPMGSTELGTGGLSPLPDPAQNQSTVLPTGTSTVPCPTGTSTIPGSSISSGC